MTLNNFKVFQHETGINNLPFISFLRDNIALLISAQPVPRQIQELTFDLPDRLTGRHFPSMKQPLEGSVAQRPSKKCQVCAAHGIKTNKGGPVKTVFVYSSALQTQDYTQINVLYNFVFMFYYITIC